MNIITLLAIITILAVLCLSLGFITRRREECHNAKTPKEAADEQAPTEEASTEEASKVTFTESIEEALANQSIPDAEIFAKMGAGLTREQAIENVTNQRKHDKALAKKG